MRREGWRTAAQWRPPGTRARLEVLGVLILVGGLAGDELLRAVAQVAEHLQRVGQLALGAVAAAGGLVVGARHLDAPVLLARLQEVLQVLAVRQRRVRGLRGPRQA